MAAIILCVGCLVLIFGPSTDFGPVHSVGADLVLLAPVVVLTGVSITRPIDDFILGQSER